jgi:hypothetical protein
MRMEGQWNCTSNPNDANEHCVACTQNRYVYTLLKGVLLFRAMNFCVGESMPSGAGQWTPDIRSPCLLDQGQWTFHLGSRENDPTDFSTLG